MNKFLVLGIGNAQVDLLRELAGKFEVHALANSSAGRGRPLAEKFALLDIVDTQSVMDYCRQHSIDYVYSVGSDIAMPTVSFVAERLGLPLLVPYEAAAICCNKDLMRERLRDVYGAVPFVVLDKQQIPARFPLPAMVKPVDSQGQRGVTSITDWAQLPEAFANARSYSRSGKVILEQKVIGQEISVNVYLTKGHIVFFLASDRISWPDVEGGIIHKHRLPASLTAEALVNVRKLVEETLVAIGLSEGPAYFQIKVCGNTPFLIEVTPRLDGCHMWRLIKKSTGVDLLSMVLKHLQGLTLDVPQSTEVTPGVLEFFCQAPGEKFKAIEKDLSAECFELYYHPGELVMPQNGKMEKCGYKIVLDEWVS
jgi:biotin carboxylase